MKAPILPKLEIPPHTLLLYENVAVNDPDRSGNWRFLFREDGCFFNARNTELQVIDPNLLNDENPALHWNTPFPSTPDRCLTKPQQAEFTEALRQANFASLAKYYSPPVSQHVSHSSVERWTMLNNNTNYTVIVENKAAPPQLVQLRATIDQLVVKAPQQR